MIEPSLVASNNISSISKIEIEATNNIDLDIYYIYCKILSELNDEYPYITQIWNYIPDIDKNYNAFNDARKKAFTEYDLKKYPVSTCVSNTVENIITIYYEIVKIEPIIIDNPRQILPENYPEKYGTSPLFSRAAIINGKLTISGTASIIGSTTIHKNDLVSQVKETMLNIDSIIEQANKILHTKIDAQQLVYMIYLKDIKDKYIVEKLLNMEGISNILCTQANMCRADLLIEIEAFQE